jgi:ring-1,2-phenylacetyl-CoA epoxidase subunit PaaE
MTPRFHSLKISDVRKETADCVSIAFEVPEDLNSNYRFLAGQYLTLKTTIDGEEIRRSYSLCSAPFENEWRVAIKQVENGKFSTFANSKLIAGDYIDVMTPMGNFALKNDVINKKSYALFAAGSGVTPILSIAKEILNSKPNSIITLFYGNKGFNDVIFREELEDLKNRNLTRLSVVHVFSRESLGNKLQKGRIDKLKTIDLYNAFLKNISVDEAFICGPEQMILGVKEALVELGVDSSKVHFELFKVGMLPHRKKKPQKLNYHHLNRKLKLF